MANDKNPTPKVGEIALDQPLPPHLLAKLKRTQEEHTARVLAHQEALGPYPDPADVEEFDEPHLTMDVFPGRIGLFGGDVDSFRRGRQRRPQGRGQQGGKGKGKSGGGTSGGTKRPLPNPQLVHQRVAAILAPLPHAGLSGNIQVLLFNAEFGDPSKARYFQDALLEIVSRAHVLFLEEVDAGFIAHLAKVSGHSGYCSTANTRNQAVGFLVHPRLKLVNGPIEYSSVANVQGVPDLRPAFRLDLEDTVTGEKFSVCVLHLKSMRGGPAVTANVRYRQFQLVVQALGPNYVGFVGGDLNFKIDDPSCKEADPMIQDGYTLVAGKGDHQATQIMGSRIDGVFHKGLKSQVDFYRVFAYFADAQLKRALSDHGTLKVELLCASPNSNQSATFQSFGTTDDGDDEQIIGGVKLPNLLRVADTKGKSRTGRKSGRGARSSRKR